MFYLTGFHSIPPRYRLDQKEVLTWLAEAHGKAERARFGSGVDLSALAEKVKRYACGPETIARRNSELKDFSHRNWEEMDLFRLTENPRGAGMGAKNEFFHGAVQKAFEKFYPEGAAAPDEIIHVTCTGYHSPSAAQVLVEKRDWCGFTGVTHAYHMGCYAAFPALRIATGFLLHPEGFLGRKKKRVDVVHTELCTLHLNPEIHTPEEIVVESLFADGLIRYSVHPLNEAAGLGEGFQLFSLREEMVPHSLSGMTWTLDDGGMKMNLSREVPGFIMQNVRAFVDKLLSQTGSHFAQEKPHALFAVHPGGPLIVDLVEEALQLRKFQLEHSRKVLFERGNISSSAVPHILKEILDEKEIAPGTRVIALAFGPGLTVCGAYLRKA